MQCKLNARSKLKRLGFHDSWSGFKNTTGLFWLRSGISLHVILIKCLMIVFMYNVFTISVKYVWQLQEKIRKLKVNFIYFMTKNSLEMFMIQKNLLLYSWSWFRNTTGSFLLWREISLHRWLHEKKN